MALNVSLIALLKYMDVVRPVIAAFGEESSSGNAEFSPAFVTEGFELFIMRVDKGEIFFSSSLNIDSHSGR